MASFKEKQDFKRIIGIVWNRPVLTTFLTQRRKYAGLRNQGDLIRVGVPPRNVAGLKMNLKLIPRPLIDDDLELAFQAPSPSVAQPFDLSELDTLPQPTDDDPPYRPWWVVDKL